LAAAKVRVVKEGSTGAKPVEHCSRDGEEMTLSDAADSPRRIRRGVPSVCLESLL